MIDRSKIGSSLGILTVDVEKGQLRFFAKATGEKNPVYTDEEAAKAAGYRSLPAPPTFGFSLGLAAPDPFAKYTDLGIDLGKVLHGEQNFEYFEPICAGDTITLEDKITDIFDKKGGALEFLVIETSATNQDGKVVSKSVTTTVVRHG
ncbi:MaoC family dehydratase N-terminal domain-containing protein [Qipengyuania nanhaisediminis]|uniref:MaoC family dehydratase N-terminal domain-containing protein n=1 Tax=Qipengyuania nanhaisediminis TaxID=604088 RepID=UPI0038B3AA30